MHIYLLDNTSYICHHNNSLRENSGFYLKFMLLFPVRRVGPALESSKLFKEKYLRINKCLFRISAVQKINLLNCCL